MNALSSKMSGWWRRARRFCIHNILRADDPPKRLALGVAVGIFIAFLPLIGVKTILAVGLAWLVGGNKAVGVPLVWISNPLTFVTMYYPGYWLGCKLMHVPVSGKWIETLRGHSSWIAKIEELASSMMDVATPLFLGTFLVASVLAIASYYSSIAMISSYRMRRWGQLMPPTRKDKVLRLG